MTGKVELDADNPENILSLADFYSLKLNISEPFYISPKLMPHYGHKLDIVGQVTFRVNI